MSAQHPARRLWHSLETLYQPALSVEHTRAAGRDLGLRGFWMTLVAFRAAPLGAVDAAAATAAFGGFAPDMIGKAIPAAWRVASPEQCIDRRGRLAGELLRPCGVTEEIAASLLTRMAALPAALDTSGRPLGAANAAVAVPGDPVAALWQLATTVREHRGDGHLRAWGDAGISGLQSHHLLTANPAEREQMRELRGWTVGQWNEAADALVVRGLLEADGALTAAARDLRNAVEQRTDELSWAGGVSALGEEGVDEVCAALAPVVGSIRAAGLAPMFTLLAGLADDIDEPGGRRGNQLGAVGEDL